MFAPSRSMHAQLTKRVLSKRTGPLSVLDQVHPTAVVLVAVKSRWQTCLHRRGACDLSENPTCPTWSTYTLSRMQLANNFSRLTPGAMERDPPLPNLIPSVRLNLTSMPSLPSCILGCQAESGNHMPSAGKIEL
ncbi:unnamed protein product [Ectocarpus sp. 13 AM-2016]